MELIPRVLGSIVVVVVVVIASLVGCKRDEGAKPEPPKSATAGSAPVVAAPSSSADAGADEPINGRVVAIDVGEHGFTPNEVDVKKGEPTTLVFTRTSNSTCAFEVVFPELNVKKDLPMKRAVPVPIPVDKEATYAFQCGMGMYKSKVVVQ